MDAYQCRGPGFCGSGSSAGFEGLGLRAGHVVFFFLILLGEDISYLYMFVYIYIYIHTHTHAHTHTHTHTHEHLFRFFFFFFF